jgi:peptidyl-prolyl cis-trans isomerase SurA
MKRLIFFLIIITLKENISLASIQNKILVNIGNQIITSYELKNRVKTILVLNNKELSQENINRTKSEALNFLINFKLKKEEIIKYKITANNNAVLNHLDSIASNYNTDKNGLKAIFENNDLSYELFLDGIKTEFAWQQLIFNSYQDKIKLNEKEIDEELNEIITKQKEAEEYNLAEIEIILENNVDNEKKIEEIKNQINEIGFKNTAIKYSTSLSALEGGDLGWIASQALSNMILNTVKKMKTGDTSEPIFQSETATFIKLLDKRKISFNDINLKKMKSQIISQKKNELLNLFSNSYLSKIKNTTLIKYNE